MHRSDSTPDSLRAAPSGSLETREVRWFAPGPLPDDVAKWFMANGRAKTIEKRIDSYLLTGKPDIGIKRRERSLLEVKWRTARAGTVPLLGIGIGSIEHWTKVGQPHTADGPHGPWVDVEKVVLTERHVLESDQGTATCEIEVASVSANGISAWTLAFESFGPSALRPLVLNQAVDIFAAERRRPAAFSHLADSVGYPEWLISMEAIGQDGYDTRSELHPA